MWMINDIRKVNVLSFAGIQADCLFLFLHFDCCCVWYLILILHSHFYVYFCFLNTICCKIGGDEDAVLSDMYFWHHIKPHMAIDTRPGVPTAIGLLRVVHANHQFVWSLVFINIRCDIDCERSITITMLSGLLTIYENFCFLVHTFEVEFQQFIF